MSSTEWAILTEHLDFLTKEMWARIQSDYPVNIYKEQKDDRITKMTLEIKIVNVSLTILYLQHNLCLGRKEKDCSHIFVS